MKMKPIQWVLILFVLSPFCDSVHREKRKVPPIEIACTIFTIAKSCTPVLNDCETFCETIHKICVELSSLSQVVNIACDDNSTTSAMMFFQDASTVAEFGVKDAKLFWAVVKQKPLEVVQYIVVYLIDKGDLNLLPMQFLEDFGNGIKQVGNGIESLFSDIGNDIEDTANTVGDKIVDALASIVSGNSTSQYFLDKLVVCLCVAIFFVKSDVIMTT